MHLIELGRQNPNDLFIGFEIRFKRAVRTIEKAKREGIDNVYICRVNASFMRDIFPKDSLSGVYINFPDPWPKDRHRKNRLLTKEFLEEMHSLLKEKTFFSFKTDHRDYF